MPIFKKSASDSGRLSESHRKVLQRCRFRLIKDIDVSCIIDYMSAEDGFRHDFKEQILSFPSRELKNGAFLDRLETRGDRAFSLFLEALHEKYKHLAFILEECLRTIDEVDLSDHEIMNNVKGENIRRMLLKNQKKKLEQSHYSESVDDLDDMCFEKESNDYIECYTVPVRGRLQVEPWIKESKEIIDAEPVRETSYMGKLEKWMLFKEIPYEELPEGIKRPPAHCKIFIEEDNEAVVENHASEFTYPKPAQKNQFQNVNRSNNHRHARDPLPPKPKKPQPPPVPPKSLSLPSETAPPLPDVKSPNSKNKSPVSVPKPSPSNQSMKESDSAVFSSDSPSKEDAKDLQPPVPERTPESFQPAEEPGTSSSPEPNAPPVPPRITSAGQRPSLDKPPPPQKSESKPLPTPNTEEKPTEEKPSDEKKDEEEECDESLMSTQIPAPDETEEDSSAQTIKEGKDMADIDEEDYEAIGNANDDVPKGDSSEIAENASAILKVPEENACDDSKPASRSLTPASLGRFSTSDSDGEVLSPVLTNHKVLPKPPNVLHLNPRPWSEVPILPNNDGSSDGDSYYEDIDAMDGVKSPSMRGSNAYLHPRSVGRSMDKRVNSLPSGQQTAAMKSVTGSYVELKKDELLVVEVGEVIIENANRTRHNTTERIITPEPITEAVQTSSPIIEKIPEVDEEFSPPSVARTIAALEASGITPQSPIIMRAPSLREKKETASKGTQYVYETPPSALLWFKDTVLCFDKLGQAFYIKKENVKHFGNPEGEPWFYPVPITSQQATLFLRMVNRRGCFLVYKTLQSSFRCPYNLSVCRGNGDVIHYHILQNSHNDLMVEGHDHSFLNIQELVTYFQSNKSQLATRLRRPLKEVDMPITPGYHYEMAFELRRKDISLSSNIIGRGNFGVVCSGTYQNNEAVAVKVLQNGDDQKQEEDDFIEEARMMMGLKHDHIIRLIGISCSAKPFFLVTEYIPNGSLRKCLHNSMIPNDHIDILFDICLQATSAMCYLEGRRYLLHRDLAARNILVTNDTCIKLADFGRARHVVDDNYQAEKSESVAIKWASPEVLTQSVYSTKSDVWALGVLYWEILSGGEMPYGDLSGEHAALYVTEGGRLEKPPGCSRDLFKVMKQCWREQPTERPSFAMLYDTLKSKSSIYYSSETMQRNRAPKKTESFRRNKTPLSPSRIKKMRHKSDSLSNKVARRSTMSEHNKVPSEGESLAKSRERIPTSSSETSLTSTVLLEKDDMTRGNKIRKSLRKMISMKPKNKSGTPKGSQNGNTPESSYQDYN